MSAPTGTATGIPRWPKISVALNADGTGRLTIDGRDERLTAGDIDAARSIVLERVVATAATVGRPVRLHSSDPDGQWELAVHPDGRVDELAAHPVLPPAASAPDTRAVVTAPVRARQPIARSTPSARRGRRVAVRAAAALALLTGLASAAALVLTNGPATVVRGSTPITPISAASTPDEASRAAAVASGQRATQRRQAAEQKRRQREALQRRVAARQARERRAARRRAAARRAARNARRAAARRRSSAPASRPARANPPARRAAPAPRAAPEFTAPQPACGEFDLC